MPVFVMLPSAFSLILFFLPLSPVRAGPLSQSSLSQSNSKQPLSPPTFYPSSSSPNWNRLVARQLPDTSSESTASPHIAETSDEINPEVDGNVSDGESSDEDSSLSYFAIDTSRVNVDTGSMAALAAPVIFKANNNAYRAQTSRGFRRRKIVPAAELPPNQVLQTPKNPRRSQQYIVDVLNHHNYHRRNHSAPDIRWSNALAQTAQRTASSCMYRHDTTTDLSIIGDYGQNIAAGVPAENVSFVISDLFYNDEMENYRYLYGFETPRNIHSHSAFHTYGHFTQMVWRETTTVGCATVDCSRTGNGPRGLGLVSRNVPPYFTVCNYQKPGNVMGAFAQNVKPPRGFNNIQWSSVIESLYN